MNINAIFVYTATEFDVDRDCTIEQLVRQSTGGNAATDYATVSRALMAKQTFSLAAGVYRLRADVVIQHASGTNIGDASLAGTTPSSGFEINPRGGTKTSWPDPPVMRAAKTLDIPLEAMKPFLFDAGEEAELLPAPRASKLANG